jgi:hypothetical protein
MVKLLYGFNTTSKNPKFFKIKFGKHFLKFIYKNKGPKIAQILLKWLFFLTETKTYYKLIIYNIIEIIKESNYQQMHSQREQLNYRLT